MKTAQWPKKNRSALKIAAIYALSGGLWILFTDVLLVRLVSEPHLQMQLQTFKGWSYVLVTAVLAYVLVSKLEGRVHRYLGEITQKYSDWQVSEARLKQRVEEMVALNTISQQVSKVATLDDVLKTAVAGVRAAVHPDVVLLFIKDQDELHLKAMEVGDPKFRHDATPVHRVGECLCGLVARDRKPVYSRQVGHDPRCTWEECKRVGIQSFAALPLVSEDQVIGVLGLASGVDRDFELQAAFLETLAASVSIGLRNALLHEEIARHVADLEKEIASRQQGEKAQLVSEQRLRHLIQASPMGMHMYRLDAADRLVLIDANPAADRMTNVDNRQRLGMTMEDAFPGLAETEIPMRYRAAAREGIPWQTQRLDYTDGKITGAYEVYAFQTAPGEMAVQFMEVTELKRTQEALQKSLALYEGVVETTDTGFLILDPQGHVIDANQEYVRLTGHDHLDQIRGRKVTEWTADHEKEKNAAAVANCFRDGYIRNFEIDYVNAQGKMTPIEINATVVQIEGAPHIVTLCRNITERRRAAAKLAETQSLLYAAIECSPAGILVADAPSGNIRMVNRAALGIRGATATPLVEIPIPLHPRNWQCFYPDGTPYQGEDLPLSRAILKGEICTNIEVIIRNEKNEDRWVLATSAPVRNEQGEIVAGIVVFPDVTELKQAERERTHLRSLLKNIIDSMPSTLVAIDTKGHITHWNRKAIQETGVPEESALGHSIADVFPHLTEQMQYIQEAIQERRAQNISKLPRNLEGEIHYEDVAIYPLVANGTQGAVIRIDNVTDRVRLEEIMIQSEKMLSVGGLAAGMAHEINNPLAGILQNVQVMRNRLLGELPQNDKAAAECGITFDHIKDYMTRRDIAKMMDAILSSGERATRVVNNMLSFSRKSEAKFTPCEIAKVLDETLELAYNDYDLKKIYDFRKIQIVRDYADNMPLVPCEASKIQQVFLNILKNGAQAMGAWQDKAAPSRFTLRIMREGEMARIEIEDNGPGMDEAIRKRIFEPFFTTKEVGIGTGLGLSVSFFIIQENHGGSITVESQPGHGAKFIIQLPLSRYKHG